MNGPRSIQERIEYFIRFEKITEQDQNPRGHDMLTGPDIFAAGISHSDESPYQKSYYIVAVPQLGN